MRTTADLNRIIDKIAENNPARFDAPTPSRAETPRSNQTELAAKGNDDAKGPTDSRSGVPRLAADSDSQASPRSGRTRRRTPNASLAYLAPLRPSDERGKNDKTDKISADDAKKRAVKAADEENKRTQRRRQIDPTTCERDYSADEIEFMKALDDYKRTSGRLFPTCSEILEVFKSLGYVKTARAEPTDDSPKRNAQQRRVATPAFLSDEENDAFPFDDALVPGVA